MSGMPRGLASTWTRSIVTFETGRREANSRSCTVPLVARGLHNDPRTRRANPGAITRRAADRSVFNADTDVSARVLDGVFGRFPGVPAMIKRTRSRRARNRMPAGPGSPDAEPAAAED